MSFFREMADYIKFSFNTPKQNKQIVFYAEHGGYYPNYEGLIEELVNERKVPICYITSDANDPIFKKKHELIKTFYFKQLLPYFMLSVECKVFVITLTELNLHHLKRSINDVHYVYVFHSMVSTHMIYAKHSFDHYDSILCVGAHHTEEIREFEQIHQLPQKKLIEAGYYRLERIYRDYQKYKSDKKSKNTPLKVLLAPSWGEHNILVTHGVPLVKLLLEQGYQVIVRPHPETFKRRPHVIEELEKNFKDHNRYQLERSVSSDDSLFEADILICDFSGIAIEYAFGTERPVLFLDLPYKVRNKDYQELNIEPMEVKLRSKMGRIVSPENIEHIPDVIHSLIEDQQDFISSIRELREQYTYHFGNSSKVGVDYILSLQHELKEQLHEETV